MTVRPIAAVVVASSTRSSAALINYVLSAKKDQKGERYVIATGVHGLFVSRAEAQFRDVRKRHGKDRAGQFVQAYHVIQAFAKDGPGAFDPDDPDDWVRAHEEGRALAELKAPGRQALVVTQRDGKTGCLHNHIVINSVERETGRSYDSSWITHSRLVQEHDALLAEHGYVQRDDLRQAANDSKERYERGEVAVVRGRGEQHSRELRDYAKWLEWDTARAMAADLGEAFSTVEPFSQDVLTGRVRDAMDDDVRDWDSFVAAGARHGVKISRRGKDGRGIRYGMVRAHGEAVVEPTSRETRRDETLGAEFTLDALETLWARETDQKQAQATTTLPTPAPSSNVPNNGQKPTGKSVREDPATSAAAAVTPPPASAAAPAVESLRERFLREMEAETAASRQRVRDAWEAARKPSPEPVKGVDSAPAATAPGDADVSCAAAADTTPTEGDRVEPATFATAPVTAAPASAAAPAVADDEYRSRLRDVRVRDQKRQELIEAVAAFEEHSVSLLEQGEVFAETDVPKGIGRKFLDTYGDRIDPEVLYILETRETKKERASVLFERGQKVPGTIGEQLRDKARRLRQEVKLGEYAMDDDVAAPGRGPQLEQDRAASGPDLDQELT